ncbi:hypothetical protein [Bacillus massiliglaciei]|uniref:hypothetical protein n=1 Tax=Bacillus massiliglaciei TaxID=1816693 RepID=UPI000DA6168F|nr:hypothetical protein [Bacillus massiliglaciei]
MAVCPLCNGLRAIQEKCPNCSQVMEDSGKVMDYYDEYSAYEEINTLKQNDGFPDSLKNEQCPHLLHCPECGADEVVLVKE